MILLLLTTALAQEPAPPGLAHPGREGLGQLVVAGDAVGPAVVERVEVHPEFERVHLVAPDVVLPPVELVERRLDREGICVHHGLTLFPRWELVGPVPEDAWHEGERPPQTVEEQVHAALCARLDAVGEGIALGRVPAAPGEERRAPPVSWLALPVSSPPVGWLQPVVGLFALLAALAGLGGLRRLDRAGWRDLGLVALVAVLLRAFEPATVFNGALAGFEKLGFALGWGNAPALYGQGWRALLAPVVDPLGGGPLAVLEAHRWLAALAPVALWAALRPLATPRAALLGGLFLAVLPLHVRLSATEVMTGPALTLLLVAAAAAVAAGSGWSGLAAGALAGLAAGLAVHVRPEALLLLPAVAALPFLVRGRAALRDGGPVLAAVLGGLLVLLRLAELPRPGGEGPLQPDKLLHPLFLLKALLPRWEGRFDPVHLFLDAAWTSPLLWLGVGLALVGAARSRAWRPLLPWLLWVAATFVLLAKSWPLADAHRLQLLAMPGWLALAALGLDRLGADRRGVVGGAVLLVALPLLWARLDLARHHEWRWLVRALPALPAESVVRFDDSPAKAPDMALVLSALNPGLRWLPASTSPPRSGQLLLRGLTCVEGEVRAAGQAPGVPEGCRDAEAACELVPISEVEVPANSDLDAVIDPARVHDGQVTLGIYRLEACRGG